MFLQLCSADESVTLDDELRTQLLCFQEQAIGFYGISKSGMWQREAEEQSVGKAIPIKQNTFLKLGPKITPVNSILTI